MSGATFQALLAAVTAALNPNFGILTWTGTGSPISPSGLGFSPDMVLIKSTSAVANWAAFDTGRGVQKLWPINTQTAQSTDANSLTSFDAGGFTVGTTFSSNGATYIAYCWKTGSAQFDLQNFTGNGTNGRLVNHNLGVTPGWVINKDPTGAFNVPTNSNGVGWTVTSAKFINGGTVNPTTYTTGTESSTQFCVANTAYDNVNTDPCLAYLFGALAGKCASGVYTGNGSASGPSVTLGFQPRFVMITVNGTGSLYIFDSKNNSSSPWTNNLALDSTAATATGLSVTPSANGFQITTSSSNINTNASTYFYVAYA